MVRKLSLYSLLTTRGWNKEIAADIALIYNAKGLEAVLSYVKKELNTWQHNYELELIPHINEYEQVVDPVASAILVVQEAEDGETGCSKQR